MNIPPYDQFVITLRETWNYKRRLSYVFLITVIMVLAVGVLLPKSYLSSATLLMDRDNVMKPLMKERAVLSDKKDWARDAQDKVLAKDVLRDVIKKIDWSSDIEFDEDAIDYERYINKIRRNARIKSSGKNTLVFIYKDTNPQRAFEVTQNLVEMFVLMLQDENRKKSSEAFNFISDQVDSYHTKLTQSEDRLRVFKTDKYEGSISSVSSRISTLELQLEAARIMLSESKFKLRSLRKQLAGEKNSDDTQGNKRAINSRISALQEQLDKLRLSYHDSYPDIVSIKVQINELEKKIDTTDSDGLYYQEVGLHENTDNLLLQQIKGDISTEASNIEAHKVRITKLEDLLSEQKSRSERIHGNDAELSELTRDYNVNNDIYQDLLKRRENARLSMNIELEQKGTSFRVVSPAIIPKKPSGFDVWHFWLMAPLVGLALPVALMYAMIMFDQRIRYKDSLSEYVDAKILTSIPVATNPSHALLRSKDTFMVFLTLGLFVFVYFGFAMINLVGVF